MLDLLKITLQQDKEHDMETKILLSKDLCKMDAIRYVATRYGTTPEKVLKHYFIQTGIVPWGILTMIQSGEIVRLSKIQVNPDYLEEYMKYAMEVGTASLETEPGVLTMYTVADKENPCNITILETYASQEAYKSHIASDHFQKYKQGTLHMVDSLRLDDVTPLNPDNQIINSLRHE